MGPQGKENPTDRERAENSNSRKRKNQSKKSAAATQAFSVQAAQAAQAAMAQQMVQQLAASLPKGSKAMGAPGMLDPAQQQQLQLQLQMQQMQAGQPGQVPQQQLLGLTGGQAWLPVSGGMVTPMMPGQDLMAQYAAPLNHAVLF